MVNEEKGEKRINEELGMKIYTTTYKTDKQQGPVA